LVADCEPRWAIFGVAIAIVLTTALGAGEPAMPKERGMWFWSKPASPHGAVNVIGQGAREAEALATFGRWGIKRLYGSYATLPVEAPEKVAAWNRRLHGEGIRSEALFADGNAITPAGRATFLRQVDERVLAFNATRRDAAERFDGIALDIEPHALPRWKAETAAVRREMLGDLLGLCEALRAHLDANGGRELAISAALAYWLDRLPPEGRVGWKSAQDRDEWFKRLAQSVASISLMAYERSAPTAILEATAWERANFPGRVVTALRARMGVEWRVLGDLQRVLPEVEAVATHGIDLENYELLRLAEAGAAPGFSSPPK
jgi:hypothetical protein